jgi:hypothetical protein
MTQEAIQIKEWSEAIGRAQRALKALGEPPELVQDGTQPRPRTPQRLLLPRLQRARVERGGASGSGWPSAATTSPAPPRSNPQLVSPHPAPVPDC